MLGLKNLAMLPSYFDFIFVYLKQKARLRPDLGPKFLSTLGPNPTRLTTVEETSSLTQLVEQWTGNPKAAGSNPVGG